MDDIVNLDDVAHFPVNATIISFLPFEYNPSMVGMFPAFFHIPAAPENDFVVVPICDCKSYVYISDGRSLPTWHNGIMVASAIVRDYIIASQYTTPDGFPGMKSIPGKHTKEDIKKMFGPELKALQEAQKKWFGNLVKMADDIWTDPNARGKQASISDLMRYAAKNLMLNREWLTVVTTDNVNCFACGYAVPSSALICSNCKTALKPEELQRQQDLRLAELKKAQPVQEATK
jgi:predicted nucleic acid-binding Zn ribbon protein